MPLVLLVLFSTVATFIAFKTEMLQPSHTTYRESGFYAPGAIEGEQLTERYKYLDLTVSESVNEVSEDTMDLIIMDEVLLKTCRTIHILALKNNCSNKYKEGTIWAFLGTPNVSFGTLSSVLLSAPTTVPPFSCGNISAFGKALVVASLPMDFISRPNRVIRYDLRGMLDSDVSDPCGYTDIVAF